MENLIEFARQSRLWIDIIGGIILPFIILVLFLIIAYLGARSSEE